jgi:catechol 2,3-dioxygenase-like lactoylglutathione lyase family enzyme
MRRIDHIVVAVADLDRASDLYRDLGFQLGARNRHPWGTENRLVQFERSFIELITLAGDGSGIPAHGKASFSFGAFVRDYLSRREGMAMLCLDSVDAEADAAEFRQEGFGAFLPFFFERKGRRPDGGETHVAFTLAFARDERIPDAAFFVCQQHFPEQFWNAALQRHANGATGISAVTLQVPDPDSHAAFLSGFCGVAGVRRPDGTSRYGLDGGHVAVASDVGKMGQSPHLASFVVRVSDAARQAERLEAAGIPFTNAGDRLTVAPNVAFGVGIEFERAAS